MTSPPARGQGFLAGTALGIILIATTAQGALSATITVHAPDGDGRVFVDVVGQINDEDFKTFKERTDQIYPIGAGHPNKQMIVTLMSYGGSISPALQIADQIRKRGMSTFVPGDRTCASACAYIWLAGRPRTVGDTPRIGFHAIYDRTTRQESGTGNAVVGAYLRDLGLGYKAIVSMTRKGPTSVEWLTPDVAKELGVTWAPLQPPRAIPIAPKPKLQPGQQPPPQVIEAWSKWATSVTSQQLPIATAPASAKQPAIATLPARPVIPGASQQAQQAPPPRESVPQQGVPTPQTQQPAAPLEGLQKGKLSRFVPSGMNRTIEFLYATKPDCSPIDDSIEVRTTKTPEHGAVEVVPTENFPNYAREATRYKCNERKVRGINVNYKSSEGYVGPDEFVLLILYPGGFGREIHFNIVVR
jgi:hypothetical protein